MIKGSAGDAPPRLPGFDDLPRTIPIFPLVGVSLLPRGRLPLNIFEPRYLAMTRDALAGNRMIGMIQPIDARSQQSAPETYRIGCMGMIDQSEETNDGRIILSLYGVCRFQIVEELAVDTAYRQVHVSYARWRGDLEASAQPLGQTRIRLLKGLKAFLGSQGVKADWKSIDAAPDETLVNSLAMICPFAPREKQALMEALTLQERARTMTTLVEMALLGQSMGSDSESKPN